MAEVETAEKMDTSSPPGSPAAKSTSSKKSNHDSEESSNHSTENGNSTENSNCPTNNNDGVSEENASKTNGVNQEDPDSQDTSSDTSKKSKSKDSVPKQPSNKISDTDSKISNNDASDSNEGEESSDEDGSEEGSVTNIKDTVSVHSDSEPETVDDSTRDGHSGSENNDVVMIDTPNEVHEIDSEDDDDDCVVTNETEVKAVNGDTLDSDLEMDPDTEDPLDADESIQSNNSKSPKSEKPNSVIVLDSDALTARGVSIHPNKVNSSTSTQSITESLALRGSTITAVSVKSNSSTQVSTVASNSSNNNMNNNINNAPLLPTLTDDMFVVEAPSFIVPYVYEKPSIKPFREFVDKLGKELEEQRAKEEKERLEEEAERLEKEKEQKERRRKDREERKAKGEEVSESETEEEEKPPEEDKQEDNKAEEEKPKEKKPDKKSRKKRRSSDASWDGDSDQDSEEEQISEDDEMSTVVLKEKDESDLEEMKTMASTAEEIVKPVDGKPESFFENNLGKFFINIGLGLVQEYVQADLLKQQKRKLRKEQKMQRPHTKEVESAIKYLTQNLNKSKEQNTPYHFEQRTCKFCLFTTESALVMANHMETPHMKNNIYTCNFCSFEIRSPHDILFHTEAEHNTRSRLERAPSYHQCANCPFEDNGKGKLARHLIACAKKFKPEVNLAPPIDWEPPAKIPKLTRNKNSFVSNYNQRTGAPLGRPPTISGPAPRMGRPPLPANVMPRGQAPITGAPFMRGGVMMRPSAPAPMNVPLQQTLGKISHQPSISITPLPRAPQPQPLNKTQNSFVICEICDGYIKDLQQLRSHMQWIHKVKIHPKMIHNRPPLNCQKCQFRFFTDQGLERHLLGSHGLVTSSMQETANQGKDAGRCPVCGRVYQWKLLNHVAKDHNMTLKPAHLSYKCTVCTATFGMYKQFESHVYSAHSAVGKRMADGKPPTRVGDSSITIVPSGKGAKV